MESTSRCCFNLAHPFFPLESNQQKILKVALAIVIIAGITLSALSVAGYLPLITCHISSPVSLIALIGLALLTLVSSKKQAPQPDSNDELPMPQALDNTYLPVADSKLIVLNMNELEFTGKTVTGTGSGESPIHSHDGIEYVLKKNNLVEFYAGRLYKLILGDRSPNIIFVKDNENESFYVGSQYEKSFEDIWRYRRSNKLLIEADKAGLAKIVMTSFLLGEIDLGGLSACNGAIGIIERNGSHHYFKIDHEQSFTFGGDNWRKRYEMDNEWEINLWDYCVSNKLTEYLTREDLKNAAQEVASIPLQTFEAECDSCEELCHLFPKELKRTIKEKTEVMFFNSDIPIIKDAVIQRIKKFKNLALEKKVRFE